MENPPARQDPPLAEGRGQQRETDQNPSHGAARRGKLAFPPRFPTRPPPLLVLPLPSANPATPHYLCPPRPRPGPLAESMARAALRLGARARALALLVLVSVALLPLVSSDDGYKHCEGIVRGWADSSTGREKDGDKLSLKDLLFFLHIPRTGGRTYFHCFLKKLYTNAQECPRSYDKLRFDPSHPDCKLVVSHDDYSLTSKLPRERTSVVTILRNPVDRVFSTYEFSVEVAARFLVHPNLTSAKLMTTRVLRKSRAVSTLDIWPWKYLVPWMREDLFARRYARGIDQVHSSKKVKAYAYDVEDMVMPLHQYINDPVAHEIIHNGATFQITGLSNNSYFDGAHDVRHCVRKHPDLGRIVLEVAKNRLDQMLYVGLTEVHEESASLFAHMVGAQVFSQSGTLNLDLKEDLPSETDSHPSMVEHEDEETNEHLMTIGKLMEAYETCIAELRKVESSRRKISLKKVEARFPKEARKLVPEAILKQIISLNSLDMELYDHAKKIFTQEHLLMLKAQQSMVGQHRQLGEQKEGWVSIIWSDGICSPDGGLPWMVVFLGLGITTIIVLVTLAVMMRKRTSKLALTRIHEAVSRF
ncbi:protein-tyrosine sulfotransferase-like isoform X2 [Miscanthus floridulus]|uniref:protein-tyrosine sulfotransferase-like isoform X2 n=1 Tax=Miscanthus floridulus TaxID=154761 RepID=UPI0034583A24